MENRVNVSQVRWQDAASRADEETNGIPVPSVRVSKEADRQGSHGVRGDLKNTSTSAEGKLNDQEATTRSFLFAGGARVPKQVTTSEDHFVLTSEVVVGRRV